MTNLTVSLDKVLIVTNSDIPQSDADANLYISLRGLTPRKLSANFGTANAQCYPWALVNTSQRLYGGSGPAVQCQTAPYAGLSIMSAIHQYSMANQIQCVLVSTHTPSQCWGQAQQTSSGLVSPMFPLASYLGASSYYHAVVGSGTDPLQVDKPKLNLRTGLQAMPYTLDALRAFSISAQNLSDMLGYFLPHGRIGFPDLTQANLAEIPLRSGGNLIQNAVATAKQVESENNVNKPHWGSSSPAAFPSLNNPLVGSLQWAQMHYFGIDDVTDFGDESLASSLGWQFRYTALPSKLQLWNALLPTGLNPPNDSFIYDYQNFPFNQNYELLPGAFGTSNYSWPFSFCESIAWNGGSGAISTVGEPISNNIPQAHTINELLIKQRAPLCMANFWSVYGSFSDVVGSGYRTSFASTAFIDPLYRPYASTPDVVAQYSGMVPWGFI